MPHASLSINLSFEPDEPADEVRSRITATEADRLSLGRDVAAKAVGGLKFAELLPAELATTVIRLRLDAHTDATITRSEPTDLVS